MRWEHRVLYNDTNNTHTHAHMCQDERLMVRESPLIFLTSHLLLFSFLFEANVFIFQPVMHLQSLRDYYESVLSVLTPLVWLGLKHQVTYFSFGAPCTGSAPWQLLAGCLSQIHHCHCLKGNDNLAKLGSKKGPNTYLWSQPNKEIFC